jgi:hypothetical protein
MTVFRYGSYSHPDGEVNLTSMTKHPNYTTRGKSSSKTVRMIGMGHICSADQSALKARISEIYEAYKYNGFSGGLVDTPHWINAAETMGGTRVVAVDFPVGAPGEMATGRTFRVILEADIPAIEDEILWFTQSMTHIGTGGVRFVLVPTRTGFPFPMYITNRTPMVVIQQGQALGMDAWVAPPLPFWASFERLEDRRITYSSPRRILKNGAYEYPSAWSYVFELPTYNQAVVIPTWK